MGDVGGAMERWAGLGEPSRSKWFGRTAAGMVGVVSLPFSLCMLSGVS